MKIGLTGGIGCGKSTVASLFKKLGWSVLDCDQIVAYLLKRNQSIHAAIVDHFGAQILAAGGAIDKEKLAAIVFHHAIELTWLENLLHPHVHRYWKKAVYCFSKRNWVIEIPLLFEHNLEIHFDVTLCVAASRQEQLKRLNKRGWTVSQVQARLGRQLPVSIKVERADFVIFNNGSLAHLRQQILYLSHRLCP